MSTTTLFFHYELEDFLLDNEDQKRDWILKLCKKYELEPETINYIFCDDEYLLDINKAYLNHDYYTDIITFTISEDPLMSDIYISTQRVKDNAKELKIEFDIELLRVMAHGILHLAGLKDKTTEESKKMRSAEDAAISLYQL